MDSLWAPAKDDQYTCQDRSQKLLYFKVMPFAIAACTCHQRQRIQECTQAHLSINMQRVQETQQAQGMVLGMPPVQSDLTQSQAEARHTATLTSCKLK